MKHCKQIDDNIIHNCIAPCRIFQLSPN